jgi:DHA1 family tetracycline resistance protein-like MFS transporter
MAMSIESPNRPRSRLLLPIKYVAVVVALLLLLFSSEANAVRSPSSVAGQKHRSNSNNNSNNNNNSNKLIKNDSSISPTTQQIITGNNNEADLLRGGATKSKNAAVTSMYWAVLHNWLYFLSLGFNLLNIPYMIREIVDGSATATPSPQAIALSGNVEAVDKILTFCGIAFLSTLSDKFGRKPLIAWSSFGFAATNLLQAFAGRAPTLGAAKVMLYVADIVDGCSSCMTPVCQAYVADCTAAAAASGVSVASLASNLGIFQGISIGGAFVIAFPVGGLLGAKYGPRLPILLSAGFGIVNGLLAIFVTPESNPKAIKEQMKTTKSKNSNKAKTKSNEPSNKINLSEVNPITGLQKLMGIGTNNIPGFGTSSVRLLRTASLTYFLLSLARGSLDAQFVNYSYLRFGWTQAQSGPVLVMTGFMLAIVPRILVPLLGLQNSINYGLLVYAIGLASAGLVSTSAQFVASIAIVAVGCGA